MRRRIAAFCSLALLVVASAGHGDDGSRPLSVNHYVRVKSTAPAIAGQDALIYVQASLEWLRDGKVNGITEGMLKLGY